MDMGEINPGSSEQRQVMQSYFSNPELIENGSEHIVNGAINLEYTVIFWDGDPGTRTNIFIDSVVYPDNQEAFAIPYIDAVLALDTEFDTPEIYLFGASSADLGSGDITQTKAFALFFDLNGNLIDGAGKKGTGYSAAGNVNNWQRFEGTNVAGDGTVPFSIAKDYDSQSGGYYYQY